MWQLEIIKVKKGVRELKENNTTKEETFEYTYSAKRQEEIESIKKKYLPPEEDKMEQLRKLDASVTLKATVYSIVIGIIGALIFGGGMSASLVGDKSIFIPGIILGIIGLVIMGAAVPVYHSIVKKQREKLAPQILALAEELSQ